MRVIFKKTEGDYLEATIEVDGVKVVAMDEFGGDRYQAGENIDIRLSVGLHYEDEEWESMFSGNPEAKKELEHQSGWRYRAYGVVTGIDPEVIVDVGITHLSAPIDTSDRKVVGESIAFTIDRLDAHSS
ncbi:hypothetical protein BCT41_24930 [Vibrio splendidus]|jgi:predicted 3-demethylubiquinone-9 3-methyltransferase (glyoxalase superfamily)|uniref:hypothetical protein n=1 Tax=Vibrio splendidus TaxID=29497 RepID=UPI000C846451|nr:hypothetical protein [Vibrio splendidus]MDH5934421.1 hypothetical protein [Vibrio splendidus]MDH5978791.1 hypothetical protein [Vibrio splendidus]PMN13404.1 hypothetical protein BCT41_24930 [Vibrio splendidus]HAS26770.1 hypothetical protein [Vibrio sp.]